ncbi:MAG: Uma2 family endonuclease, partial [Nostoc sp.]
SFQDIPKLWLRWFTLAGELIPVPTEEAATAKEEAATAKEEAATAKQEAAQARQKAEQLTERLRQLGVNPDEL